MNYLRYLHHAAARLPGCSTVDSALIVRWRPGYTALAAVDQTHCLVPDTFTQAEIGWKGED